MKAYVYLITNRINGTQYVGKTINPDDRWGEHVCSALKHKTKCVGLARAIRKHGAEGFTYEILSEFPTEQEAFDEETRLIKELRARGQRVYNCNDGGKGGVNPQRRSRQRIGDATKKRMLDPAFREKHAQAVKVAMSTPEMRAKISETTRAGMTPEVRKKISVARAGVALSDEHRAAIGNALRNSMVPRKGVLGESNPKAVATEEHVREVRKRYAAGEKIPRIAIAVNLSYKIVYGIAKCATWKHVVVDLQGE